MKRLFLLFLMHVFVFCCFCYAENVVEVKKEGYIAFQIWDTSIEIIGQDIIYKTTIFVPIKATKSQILQLLRVLVLTSKEKDPFSPCTFSAYQGEYNSYWKMGFGDRIKTEDGSGVPILYGSAVYNPFLHKFNISYNGMFFDEEDIEWWVNEKELSELEWKD